MGYAAPMQGHSMAVEAWFERSRYEFDCKAGLPLWVMPTACALQSC